MGFFSGVGSAIGSLLKAGSAAVKTFGGSGMPGGSGGFSTLNLIGTLGKSLMEKKSGGDGNWQPVNTSAGISVPSTGSYNVGFERAGSAKAPDVRLKTVDADTLNAEWEYRLKKGLRDKNLFS